MSKLIKLKDGAVLLYHHNKQSKATAFRIGVLRGGYLDKNSGMSHLFEHMLFKGTKNYTNDELTQVIRDNFSNLNAETGGEHMIIRSYESNKKLKSALEISADMLLNSNFPENELKNEKQVVRQEIIRANDDMKRLARLNLFTLIWNYPELKSDALGDEKKMMAITSKQLLNYREKNIVRENFVACVSSSLPCFVVKKYINKCFINKIKSGEKNTFESANFKINGESKMKIETMKRNKIVLDIAIPCMGFSDKKMSFLLSRVINYCSGLKGPLFNHFREKRQLVYAVSLSRWSNKEDGVLIFNIETSSDKVNDCFYALRDFINDIKTGIPQNDVERLLEKYDENDDRFVGHPVDYCRDDFYEYLDNRKLYPANMYKKFKRSIKKEILDNIIQKTFNISKVFVSVVGSITKKDVLSINKIIDILKG